MSVKTKAQLTTEVNTNILNKTAQYSITKYSVGNLIQDVVDSMMNNTDRPLSLRPQYDLALTNDFPQDGSGTGEAGEVLRGNIYPVYSPGNDGELDWGDGSGPVLVPNKSLLMALEDEPGSDPDKWTQI